MPLPQPEQLIAKMAADLSDLAQQEDTVMVGIHTGGAWVAKQLHEQLELQSELGLLDISFYRDDFSQNGLHPKVKGSQLPEIENKTVILVDDVIMSGRTIRAAMNEIFDYGRPTSIHLVSMIDIGKRQLPIQADLVGAKLVLDTDQKIKLSGPAPLALTLDC